MQMGSCAFFLDADMQASNNAQSKLKKHQVELSADMLQYNSNGKLHSKLL